MIEWLLSYYENLDGVPLVIQIALVFIVLAITLTLIAYLSILRERYIGYIRTKRQNRINPIIDNLIVTHIVMNEAMQQPKVAEYESVAGHFQIPELQPKWARKLLIDRIINYRKNIRGTVGQALRTLYLDLELDADTQRKLKSGSWNKKVQALNEYVSMDVPVSDVTLLPLTNSRNRELRAAARHAYIKLSRNEPFKFFDVVSDNLLMWDQIELFRIITTTENIVIPNFARWITYSTNKSVVSFCLKLAVHFSQTDAIPAIVRLLATRDHRLRADSIEALGKLGVKEVANDLKGMYHHQPQECQIAILKALGELRDRTNLEFLLQEFQHASNFEIRKHAAAAIVAIYSPGAPELDELLASAKSENQLILKHCMNPLIKY